MLWKLVPFEILMVLENNYSDFRLKVRDLPHLFSGMGSGLESLVSSTCQV